MVQSISFDKQYLIELSLIVPAGTGFKCRSDSWCGAGTAGACSASSAQMPGSLLLQLLLLCRHSCERLLCLPFADLRETPGSRP